MPDPGIASSAPGTATPFDELRARLEGHPLLLFDGVCNLCSRWVRFVARRDPDERFYFAPLQSDLARDALAHFGLSSAALDTAVLIEGERCWTQSGAVLRILRRLRAPWPLAYAAIVIPPVLRDAVYGFVARRRYRWFGKRESCALPAPGLERRFLA